MLQFLTFLSAFSAERKEKGATATEYALIIAVVAAVVGAAMVLFGPALQGLWAEAIAVM